jgi:hypothetical protein
MTLQPEGSVFATAPQCPTPKLDTRVHFLDTNTQRWTVAFCANHCTSTQESPAGKFNCKLLL